MEAVNKYQIGKLVKIATITILGTLLLTISAKVKIPFYPVPMTMQTFVVLFLGMAFGYKIGLLTVSLYLFEAQEMSDRIAILNKGNLVALDTTKNLLNRIKTKKIIFKVNKSINLTKKKISGLFFSSNSNNEIMITYERNKHKIEDIINIIKNEGVEIIDISTEDGNLEDVFIQLTKN